MAPTTLILALAAFTTTALAKEPFANPNPAITWSSMSAPQTLCMPSTYAKSSTLPFADYEQCVALFSSWPEYNGEFLLDAKAVPQSTAKGGSISLTENATSASGMVPVLNVMNCTLFVGPVPGQVAGDAANITIGNMDLEYIMGNSTETYNDGTDVSVTGQMDCAVVGGGAKKGLRWAFYNSPPA